MMMMMEEKRVEAGGRINYNYRLISMRLIHKNVTDSSFRLVDDLSIKEKRMLIYFAAPLFCLAERAFNLHLATRLEENSFSLFLPQRDGIELEAELLSNLSEKEICQRIFNVDRNEILKADIFLMILDGRVPDEGACVELGIAHENKILNKKEKLLIGFLSDLRGFGENFKLNAMVRGALDVFVDNEDDLIKQIKAFQTEQTH